ncbi:MAG: phage major capsid protein [Oscillospiraceae bacterium]|nr:phage major capsid protein [Oscillospiraceae bacterium]
MALKSLMLRKKIDDKKKLLDELREKSQVFQTRETELEQAITEAKTDAEKAAVEAEIDQFDSDKQDNQKQISDLEAEISGMEQELEHSEKKQETPPPAGPTGGEARKELITMKTRTNFFGMNRQERDAFFAREEVKTFLERVRTMGKEKRAISGADLLIPTIVLDLIKENILHDSKLYQHVNVKNVPGKARQNVMGAIPEAIWTEMCSVLNELNLTFNNVEVDGYKVGGYIAICNAVLEDSDIALASEIISAIGQAIGYALDKAILYSTGTKMPLGIVTRLTQATKPSGYSATARAWVNLTTSNVLAISGKADAALFKELVIAAGNAKADYSHGELFWAMNEKTFTKLVANALTINAAGAIVTGQSSTMPVIGGTIEKLSFIPDDVIIGGYGDLYLLAERAGTTIAQSEHVRFLEDQTVFKGTARYDGMPVIAEGFVAIGISGTKPAANAVTFVEDAANKVTTGD